jgi:hypothetical protein
MGEFDYLKHVLKLAGRKSQVVVKTIEGTDHSFANRVGRAAVRQHSERWLNACFPLRPYAASAVNTLSSEASGSSDYDKKRQAIQHG